MYKVGATFVDEFTFRVVKVNEDGSCIAERVDMNEQIDAVTEVKEEVETLPTYTKTQINRMPNAELEKVCKELGIEIGTGTEMKRAIIDRLGL